MNPITFFTTNLLWTAGLPIFCVTAAALLLGYYKSKILFVVAAFFLAFSLYFFRFPNRICLAAATDATIVVCPADGKVVAIEEINDPAYGEARRVAIFLSPLDVHVNWIPHTGTLTKITYRPGAFLVAYAPKSSDINERNDIEIVTPDHQKILVRQIAGMVARRICWWVQENSHVTAGQDYGMIRFGSRVEIFLPLDATVNVQLDERVYGGQTVIARLAPRSGGI